MSFIEVNTREGPVLINTVGLIVKEKIRPSREERDFAARNKKRNPLLTANPIVILYLNDHEIQVTNSYKDIVNLIKATNTIVKSLLPIDPVENDELLRRKFQHCMPSLRDLSKPISEKNRITLNKILEEVELNSR